MKSLSEFYSEFKTHKDFVYTVEEKIKDVTSLNQNFVYPDAQYNGCHYNSGPDNNLEKCDGCIFGKVFKELGVDTQGWRGSIERVMGSSNIKCPKKWTAIQILQDNGVFWGRLLFLSNILKDYCE